MDGIQKTVALGLRNLARKVEEGLYGNDDDAFAGPDDGLVEAFLEDLQDEVIGKMQ